MAVFMTAWLFYALLWILRSPILANCDGKPKFRGEPRRMYVAFLGNSVKLKCPVTGTDGPLHNKTLVAWFKGGKVIQNTHPDWSRFLIKKDKHLKIVNVKKDDAGTYVCKAMNQYGRTNLTIELKVEPTKKPGRGKPPRFKAKHKPKNIYRTGETAKLQCHSTGDPDPNVQWFKNGKSYGVDKKTSVGPEGWTLNLRYLTVEDAGRYTCRVSNNVGSINRTFTVVVKTRTLKPIIEEPDVSRRTVSQGRSVKFVCKVTSVGQVEFNWKWFDKIRHSSVDLKTSNQFGSKYIGNYTKTKVGSMNWFYFDGFLVIKDVTKKDEGKYTCIVKSNHGSDEMDFHLYVRGKGEGQQVSTEPGPTQLAGNNSADKKEKADTGDAEDDIPVALVAVLAVAIIVVLVFIAILTIYCRNQRKDLEKQYENEYQPQSMFQPYAQQLSVYQEMQKVDQNDSENGNSTETMPVTTETSVSSQGSQSSFGNRRDSKRTPSTSSEMYLANSQASLQTTLCRPHPQQTLIDYKWDAHHSLPRRTESAYGVQSSGILPRRVSSSEVSTMDHDTERSSSRSSLDRSPKNTSPQRSRESIV